MMWNAIKNLFGSVRRTAESTNEQAEFTRTSTADSKVQSGKVARVKPTTASAPILDVVGPLDELGDEQRRLFDILEGSSEHMFVTGRAGSGKSHLLRYFLENTEKNKVVVAPTGVAAVNVGGETIHRVFALPPRFIDVHEMRSDYLIKWIPQDRRRVLENIDVVVVDEVSMVRCDLMDGIDTALRIVRRNENPFGGVQIIAFGDPFQLSPIVVEKQLVDFFAHNHVGPGFFNAAVLETNQSPQIPVDHELSAIGRALSFPPRFSSGRLCHFNRNQPAQFTRYSGL